jgi:hemerythrin-like domain-containing protein
MEAYLNTGIKQIIDQFPEVGGILDEYGIGCAPCSVGTCLLKDIIEIHHLSEDEEKVIMAKIAAVLFPDKTIQIPGIKRENKTEPERISYSPAIKRLVDEHVLIMRYVKLIPAILENLEVESKEGRQLILDGVDFIRSYADKYHHAKEEEILFKYFDEEADIIKVMLEEHKQARHHVKSVLEALERKDTDTIFRHLNAYENLLTAHIKKEDNILYPLMDKSLSVKQIGELFSRFHEADRQIGYSSEKYQALVERFEEKFKPKEN